MEASAVFVLLVLPGALAVPTKTPLAGDQDACATRCPESSKFSYKRDTTYTYKYDAETRTTMTGAAEDTATLHISATVLIESLGSCEMALRMTEVSIKRSHEQYPRRMVGADDMSLARRALEDQPLRFAFYDGAVGELCPGENEDLWALNIKRGVLTSFQNSMHKLDQEEHLQEVDVTGQCPTHYKVTQKGWETLTVTKVKDILSCTDRHGYRSSLLSTPYRSPNSMQSLPLMKSSHECRHDIRNDGVLQSSSCSEMHVFRPFSKASSGASTETSQKLIFLRDDRGVSSGKGPVNRRTTLLYEHKTGQQKGESDVNTVKRKLEDICTVTAMDIRPQVPYMFGELVHLMRSLDYADLKNVDRQLQQDNICSGSSERARKFFRDALPVTATSASLRFMSDLLTSKGVEDTQATFWLTSLAFLPNPTKDMVGAVESLVTEDKTKMDALLPVSALVNNYCENNPACSSDDEVSQLLTKLTGTLGYDCNVSKKNFKEVLLTLRALGNIGRSEALTLHLEPCFSNGDVPMDVRVAAVEAYRRLPCSADRNNVMEIFLKHSEDSELRIQAYLAVMKCPSEPVVQQVRQALLSEEVNQVGSFVWTHLTNLLETDSPHKQTIRDVLENELLNREFNMDRRKYSRNYELSFFSEKFNLGGVYENNIVWSPNSFIPRSAMFNLTVDIFGKSVNLLEVGGRVQGLEYLLATYFGPGSKDKGEDGGYGDSDQVKNQKLTQTKRKYGDIKDDLRAQMYLRIFGNELGFKELDSSDVGKLWGRGDKKKSFLDQMMNKLAKQEEITFTQSAMFLDSSMVIPTAVGLPLNLTVNGSASVELKASGKIDFTKVNSKSSFEVSADIQPSGAVELSSLMSVDAYVTKVGLKMTSRLHTSTAFKGSVELDRGRMLTVELDTPRDTLELMDFESKFFIVHDDYEKEQQMIIDGRREKRACSGEPLAKIIGLELCATLAFPNASQALDAPYFPFTGPTTVALTLRKHDVHSGYKLLTKHVLKPKSSILQVSLDTPGSKVDRAVSLGYNLNMKDLRLTAELLSPWKKAELTLSADNTKKKTHAQGTLTLDSEKTYTIGVAVDKNKKAALKASMTVTSPEGTAMSLTGGLDYGENKLKLSKVVLEMNDVLMKPITFDFSIIKKAVKDRMRYKNIFKLSSEFITVKTVSQAAVREPSGNKRTALLAVSSRLDYAIPMLPKVKKNIVSLNLKLNDRSTSALKKYDFALTVDGRKTPVMNLLVNGEMTHNKALTKLEVKVRHGKNMKSKADTGKEILVKGSVKHNIKDEEAEVEFDLQTLYPDKDIEYQITGKHEHNRRLVEQYLTVRYAKGKSLEARMRLSQMRKQRTATFKLTYPGRDVKLNATLTEKSKREHLFSTMVQLQKGEKNSLVVSYKRPSSDSVAIVSELGIHNQPPAKLELSGNYRLRDMHGQGLLTWDKKQYSLAFTSDIQQERKDVTYVKWTVDAVHPERRITGLLEGGKDTEDAVKRAKLDVRWDADGDASQRAGLMVEMADKQKQEDINVGGIVEVFTPVQDYQQMKAELKFQHTSKKFLTSAETVLGNERKTYSLKAQLNHPVSAENLDVVAWLKTPHKQVRHLEVRGKHTFSPSGELSSAVKGIVNDHFLEAKLSGTSKGDIVRRIYEGAAALDSSIPGVHDVRLTFNHNDNGRRFITQTVLSHLGNQYSANLEADFVKVHWQVSTDGSVRIRAPQLWHPVELSWKHKNNLHQVNSSMTVRWDTDRRAKLDIGGIANVVEHKYDVDVGLVGPWQEDGSDMESAARIHYNHGHGSSDKSISVKIDKITSFFSQNLQLTDSSFRLTQEFTTTYPEFPLQYEGAYNFQYKDFPIVGSADIRNGGSPLVNLNFEVENPKRDSYSSNMRFVLHLEGSDVQNIIAKTTHSKKNGKWVTVGDIQSEVGKTIVFNSVFDMDKSSDKMLSLVVDTPYDEMRKIEMQYSHSGNPERDFAAKTSVKVEPVFETISSEVSWNNRDGINGTFRVNTPFDELPYLELTSSSTIHSEKRHSRLRLEYSPGEVYDLDTTYTIDFPQNVDIALNLQTPRSELPSLSTDVGFQFSDDAVNGKLKVGMQSVQYEGDFDLSWDNEIQGTVNFENKKEGAKPTELHLSHNGGTWEHFNTKAGFKMNGDRLESEVAYSNRDGRSGRFMLATPDPDLDFFEASFSQKMTEKSFQGLWAAQYGETSKPFKYGVTTTYSEDEIAFSSLLETPHTEDMKIELGLERQLEARLLGLYGENNKISTLVKYKIRESFWDVGGEFEYKIKGYGRNYGFMFKKDGPLHDLTSQSTLKYMGKEVEVDATYRDTNRKTGKVSVRTNYQGFTNLDASFKHKGTFDQFDTKVYLKYFDGKEVEGSINFEKLKSRRASLTSTLKLPISEYAENKLTYTQTYRKNKLSANADLILGQAEAIKGELKFEDNSRLTVSVIGPHKDFGSFSATGRYHEDTKSIDGDMTLMLQSQTMPVTATYMVKADAWPIMINIQADTPFKDWETTEVSVTHDGMWDSFTTRTTLQAKAVGKVTSEATWTYSSPTNLEGLWTFSSSIEGAKNLKLLMRNTEGESGGKKEHSTHMEVGWELLKEIVLDGNLQFKAEETSHQYGGSLSMTSPFEKASQVSFKFDHNLRKSKIQDMAMIMYNQRTYLDVDLDYSVDRNGRKRTASLELREPQPMAYMISHYAGEQEMEGELKLNWDKSSPMKNVHLTGTYTDSSDELGTDRSLKTWVMHPVRTMGLEHTLRKSKSEFQTDFLLTWDKEKGNTVTYDISWNDRSSRYSSSYDAMVKVGVPMRSVKMEGMYSDTGRVCGARGSLQWDADRNEDMKIGLNAELDTRGQTNRLQLDLDLPFVDKKYGYVAEGAVMSGNTIIKQQSEFSYSNDPRKLLIISSHLEDISYGSDASNYSLSMGITHPSTDISIQMTSHFGLSDMLGNLAMSMEYMTAQRQKKNLQLLGQLDKSKREMIVELKCPVKGVSVEGKLTGDTQYNLRLTAKEDGQKTQLTDIFVDPKTRTFELHFHYDKNAQGNSLNVFGHMINDKKLQTEVYRMQNGQRISETLMTLQLNSSHLLHTRLNWRPSMLTELQQYLSTQLTVFSYASSETFSQSAVAVGREVEAKYNAIMQEVRMEAGPLVDQLQKEMKVIQNQLDGMHRDLRRFYGRNALHVQDMGALINGAFESLVSGSKSLSKNFHVFYMDAVKQITASVQTLQRYPMAKKYAQLVQDLASGLKNMRTVLEQALDELSLQVTALSDRSYRSYLAVSRQIERKLQGYTAALQQSSLARFYNGAQRGLIQISNSDLKQLSKVANQKMMLALEKLGLKDSYLRFAHKAKQIVADQFSDLVQRPEFQQIYIIGNEVYQQGVWAYQYWHVEKNMRLAVAQLLELSKDIALLEITRIKNAVVDLEKSRVIVYDPTNGELQFEIYLPVPLKSLTEPPDVRLTKYVNRVKSWISTYVPSPRHSLWTTINSYMPNMDSSTWLPPYRAYAYVMGDQHVVTFDRSHYNFAGRCSYILARDMAEDRFTVVLRYNNRPRQPQVKSIMVLLRGVAIEIDTDNKVKVNNKERELPFFSGSVSAVRQQSIIRVQDGSDLTVEVDPSRGIYSVGVSGWFHGRTAGLLGTYDNEPFNDLMDSTRSLTKDVEDFANSWEVGTRSCRSRNLAEISGLDRSSREVTACEKHLSDSSAYYAPCFGQVDADELMKVCVDYAKNGLSLQEAQCKAGQQYRYMCQRRGVALSTPAECVTCTFPGGKMVSSGSSLEMNTSQEVLQPSADVVFVVEDSSCNNWARGSLSQTATELGQALTQRGLKDNRFGLVSFQGGQQFAHTIEGDVFGQPNSFLKAAENLRLTAEEPQADVLAALREGMKYPYRIGVAKLLVLVPCSACAGSEMNDLSNVLQSHGFLLHVLGQQQFEAPEKGNRSPLRIFGLDRYKVHTRKSAARNSDSIFQNMEPPSDTCSQLALQTNGSVFDVSHMKGRERIKREFLESFAAGSSQNALPPSCQVCSCYDDGTGHGHTVCRLCDNHSWLWNHIPSWLQSSSTNVMGIFNDLHHRFITSLSIPEPEVATAA